jgi:hypothetical protein
VKRPAATRDGSPRPIRGPRGPNGAIASQPATLGLSRNPDPKAWGVGGLRCKRLRRSRRRADPHPARNRTPPPTLQPQPTAPRPPDHDQHPVTLQVAQPRPPQLAVPARTQHAVRGQLGQQPLPVERLPLPQPRNVPGQLPQPLSLPPRQRPHPRLPPRRPAGELQVRGDQRVDRHAQHRGHQHRGRQQRHAQPAFNLRPTGLRHARQPGTRRLRQPLRTPHPTQPRRNALGQIPVAVECPHDRSLHANTLRREPGNTSRPGGRRTIGH